ncbi:MAG: response regulator transcription factor [Bacteroidota bacterium]
MDNIRVLIIEDNPAESDALVKVLEANQYTVVGVARTNREALELFYKSAVDIVIIDVFLGEVPDGITFAETITTVPNSLKPFVFLTSSNDRAIFDRAKLTKPYSFLMKPFNELEVLYALEMAIERFYGQNDVFFSEAQNTVISQEYLFVKKNDLLKKVLISEILYIEVEERYCTIFTEREKFVILISLTKIIELLDAARFGRTHRNFIVNLAQIEEIDTTDNRIVLYGKQVIPFSEKYKDLVQRFRLLK